MKKIMGSLMISVLVVSTLAAGNRDGEKEPQPLDKNFLIKVATCNNAEIQASKLAEKRAESSQVKEFATMIEKDHQQVGDKLAELLKGRNLAIAAGADKETREELSRLGKLEGNEFDRAFTQCMVKGHQKAIAVFENQVKNGKEEDINTYAKDVLPHLRRHLVKAQELARTMEK